MFAVGKSIIDRSSATNVGALMLEYGGGGHEAAGTCQVDNDRAAAVQAELIGRITPTATPGTASTGRSDRCSSLCGVEPRTAPRSGLSP